jgi:hypothetical protein
VTIRDWFESWGGPGSGHHGHKGVPGQRGGSVPSSGGTNIIASGSFEITKVDGYHYTIGDDVSVEIIKKSDPRWRFSSDGDPRSASRYRNLVASIKVGDGPEIAVIVDAHYGPSRDNDYSGGKVVELSASDRNTIIKEAIFPALAQIPPEHLKGLHSIRLEPVYVNSRLSIGGQYHVTGSRNAYAADYPYGGFITLNNWNGYVKGGNPKGMSGTLKHEIGHHVWENVLSSSDRQRYSTGIGFEFSDKQLSLRAHADGFFRAGMGKSKEFIAAMTTRVPDGGPTYYGGTNVFEDFAESYKGYNALSRTIDHSQYNDPYWDSTIQLGDYDVGKMNKRIKLVGGDLNYRG